MLDRDTIIATLRAHEAELRAKGVEGLYLFGSVARGEAGPNSDVDLFFDPSRPLGLDFFDVGDHIAEILHAKIDVTTRRGLHPLLRETIVSSARQVF